eukprot:m.46432 g.46432  ORF g.46432 m.46432 type:complete len:58 (+) comp15417_c0_seq2:333-506(+)
MPEFPETGKLKTQLVHDTALLGRKVILHAVVLWRVVATQPIANKIRDVNTMILQYSM